MCISSSSRSVSALATGRATATSLLLSFPILLPTRLWPRVVALLICNHRSRGIQRHLVHIGRKRFLVLHVVFHGHDVGGVSSVTPHGCDNAGHRRTFDFVVRLIL